MVAKGHAATRGVALQSAYERGAQVRVPSAVLVEVHRGDWVDTAIDAVLALGVVRVVTTGARIARIAGHLLASTGAGSAMAIDALVVATGGLLGGGLVITHDPDDLQRPSADHGNVAVVAV